MYSLNQLQRFMQQQHRMLAAFTVLLMLCVYFLELNYVLCGRDLLYWRQLCLDISQQPMLLLFTLMLVAGCCCLLLLLQRRVRGGMSLLQELLQSLLQERRERKFCSFIVRRLCMQLDRALLGLPTCGQELELELQLKLLQSPLLLQQLAATQEAAYYAVALFRRDACQLLYQQLSSAHTESQFFVLPEEELELRRAGYTDKKLRINRELLRQLLYPP